MTTSVCAITRCQKVTKM